MVTRTGTYGPLGTPKVCGRLGCPPCTTGTETVISAKVDRALTPITLESMLTLKKVVMSVIIVLMMTRRVVGALRPLAPDRLCGSRLLWSTVKMTWARLSNSITIMAVRFSMTLKSTTPVV